MDVIATNDEFLAALRDEKGVENRHIVRLVIDGQFEDIIRAATFKGVQFDSCSLLSVRINGASFTGCQFSNCYIDGVVFNNCKASDLQFTECSLILTTMRFKCELYGISLYDCTSKNGTFSIKGDLETDSYLRPNLRVKNCNLSGCSFLGTPCATCEDTKLVDTKWANLERNSRFVHCDLTCATFRGIDMRTVAFESCNMHLANMPGCSIDTLMFENCTELVTVDFSGATGLQDASEWVSQNLGMVRGANPHWLAFKLINSATPYHLRWRWKPPVPGLVLTENVSYDVFMDCGPGINLCTLQWALNSGYGKHVTSYTPYVFTIEGLWVVRIDMCDGPTIVVPENSNGKFRVGRCTLVKNVSYEEAVRLDKKWRRK